MKKLIAAIVVALVVATSWGLAADTSADKPTWGWLKAEQCLLDTDPDAGMRELSAEFLGPGGDKGCRTATKNVFGQVSAPSSCDQPGKFLWWHTGPRRGHWHRPDSNCLFTPVAKPARGADDMQTNTLDGFADIHVHQFANLAFGGTVLWGDAFGPVSEALAGLPEDSKYRQGHYISDLAARKKWQVALEILGVSAGEHAEDGYSSFAGWPSHDVLTHQQVYVDWLARAYHGGLRLMVMLAENSEDMFGRGENQLPGSVSNADFQKYMKEEISGNDMESLEWQIRGAYQLQARIDNGVPGSGWYRIVRDPQEAADVIKQGKLAVILGSELQHMFNCDVDRPKCEPDVVAEGLNRLEAMGVNYVFPIHHKENQFGGPAMFVPLDSGTMHTCKDINHNCADKGLTDRGKDFIKQLMSRGMLIDTEHMSRRSFNDTMKIVDVQPPYPVMASHVIPRDLQADGITERQKSADDITEILKVGGMVAPILSGPANQYPGADKYVPGGIPLRCDDPVHNGGADQWANMYLFIRDLARQVSPGTVTPIAIGGDWNGFAGWLAPRGKDAVGRCAPRADTPMEDAVQYPLHIPAFAHSPATDLPLMTWPDATTTWSYNEKGTPHIGMEPDFIENLRTLGLKLSDLEPLYRSASGVVNVWQNARKNAPGDLHHLRWAPESPFDVLKFEYWDATRDVVPPGTAFPICRSRATQQLGYLQDDTCHIVEPLPATARPRSAWISLYHDGQCLGPYISTPQTTVDQYTCDKKDAFLNWDIVKLESGRIQLMNRFTHNCLGVGETIENGDEAMQFECRTSDPRQQFVITRYGNSFELKTADTGKCLQVDRHFRTDGGPVVADECHQAANQLWTIDALRSDDYERLYQADKNQLRWISGQPSDSSLIAVASDDKHTRFICQSSDTDKWLGTNVAGSNRCTGMTSAGQTVETAQFSRLYQTAN